MVVRFYDIEWDIGDEDGLDENDLHLPLDITLEVDDGLDIGADGADVLSDEYGWCVKGFNFEVVG